MTTAHSSMLPAPGSMEELHERASRPTAGVVQTLSQLRGDVLVLGAGGKLGFHLSAMLQRGLQEAGHGGRVLAVSRFASPASTAIFRTHDIATLACDLTCPEQLRALPDAQTVFFLAGVKFGASADPQLLQRMNVDLPAQVAHRCSSSRIVALSTGCVYSYVRPDSGGSTETDAVDPVGDYARSCLGREQAFTRARVDCCLIRLNYAVDLQYGVLVDIAQKVLAEQPIDITMGHANVIWQGDAVAHIIQALQLTRSPASVLNVTGPRILSIREVALQFGRLLGKPVRLTGEEAPTAWLNNAALAHRLFGRPTVSEDTLMEWVADWVQQGRPTLGKPTHFEVRDGVF